MTTSRYLGVFLLSLGVSCAESEGPGAPLPVPARSVGEPGEIGGSSGTDGHRAPDIAVAVHSLELNHLSEQRPAWIETRSFAEPVSAASALSIVAAAPDETVAAVLRDGEGEIVDAQFISATCGFELPRESTTRLVPGEFATIQAALDASLPGDTVRVAAGTYHERLNLRSGVRLIGAGARDTILDGDAGNTNLVDFSQAHQAVLSGFTLRNVAQGVGCSQPDDTLLCSGNWYASAIYADGHAAEDNDPCNDPSIYFSENIVTGNDVGMMLYFHPFAVVRNNVFVKNRVAFGANHHGGASTLLVQNTFYDNADLAIAVSASFLDILNNVFLANGAVLRQEYCQRGRLRCNVLWNNQGLGDREFLESEGNLTADPLFSSVDYALDPASPALHTICANEPEPPPTMADLCGDPLPTDPSSLADGGVLPPDGGVLPPDGGMLMFPEGDGSFQMPAPRSAL